MTTYIAYRTWAQWLSAFVGVGMFIIIINLKPYTLGSLIVSMLCGLNICLFISMGWYNKMARLAMDLTSHNIDLIKERVTNGKRISSGGGKNDTNKK